MEGRVNPGFVPPVDQTIFKLSVALIGAKNTFPVLGTAVFPTTTDVR